MMGRMIGWAGVAMLLFSTGATAQNANGVATLSAVERMKPAVPASPLVTPRWPIKETATAKTLQSVPAAAQGRSVAFMIAGGALFVAGIIAGGDAGAIMMLGGAGIGAYGVYLYFR